MLEVTPSMSFYAFAIATLAFETAKRYNERHEKNKEGDGTSNKNRKSAKIGWTSLMSKFKDLRQ